MAPKALIGSVWEESVQGAPERSYFSARLDLGVLPSLACRIVENTKREKENLPTHLMFYFPIDGRDVKVGAFWPYDNGAGKEYLIGRFNLAAFGEVALRGGIRVDFRLSGDDIGVRLSKVAERRNEKSPTHQLWRMNQHAKTTSASPSATGGESESEEKSVEENA